MVGDFSGSEPESRLKEDGRVSATLLHAESNFDAPRYSGTVIETAMCVSESAETGSHRGKKLSFFLGALCGFA